MTGGAYYNEIEPYAAAWLRNLIAAGHIAPGDVDERDIRDVHPSDIRGYAQCHFFAGIGVWSYALRRAGWSDDRPVWTGSCPCQPFSAAGQGAGFADERHLWPAFFPLISQCRPASVFGEQVASKDADPWIDLVCDDLEAVGYACGAVPFPAAGVGAPHIRDRLYWVADADRGQFDGFAVVRGIERNRQDAGRAEGSRQSQPCGDDGRLAEPNGKRFPAASERALHDTEHHPESCGGVGRLGDADGRHEGAQRGVCGGADPESFGVPADRSAGPTNGLWRDADWLFCRDGKWRPVEPGAFPLAHGAPARVGRLRAYGNAINAEQAAEFIRAVAA